MITRNIKSHIFTFQFGRNNAVVELPNGHLITGKFPNGKLKLVQAWIEIHKDELMANWALAVEGSSIFKIEALK